MALLLQVGISGHLRTVLENQHLAQEFIDDMGPTSSANTCSLRGAHSQAIAQGQASQSLCPLPLLHRWWGFGALPRQGLQQNNALVGKRLSLLWRFPLDHAAAMWRE